MANQARNARAELDRHRRWEPARAACWAAIDPWLRAGGRVAIVGAGNGDDLPLQRLAMSASEVTLIDVDRHALLNARRSVTRPLRSRVRIEIDDVTHGIADAHATSLIEGRAPATPGPYEPVDLPGGPYDLVIGDLFYSQLIYPALVDAGISPPEASQRSAVIAAETVRVAVERMHRSCPDGVVAHLHDPAAWWPGHPQPLGLDDILAEADVARIALLDGPHAWDPRRAVVSLDIPIVSETVWRWPFSESVDYLVRCTIARTPQSRGGYARRAPTTRTRRLLAPIRDRLATPGWWRSAGDACHRRCAGSFSPHS